MNPFLFLFAWPSLMSFWERLCRWTTLVVGAPLSFVCLSFLVNKPSAEAQILRGGVDRFAERMVLLRKAEGSGLRCASGFILDSHTIVTSAHVTQSMCADLTCTGLTLGRTDGVGRSAQVIPAVFRRGVELGGFDVGVLHLDDPLGSFEPPVAREPKAGELVEALSFPGCETLQSARGTANAFDQLVVETSAKSERGGSGGVLLGTDGALLGIISQAQPSPALVLSVLIGAPFELRAARWDLVAPLLTLPLDARVAGESAAILSWYVSSAMPESALGRAQWSLDFFSRAERFKSAVLRSPGLFPAGFHSASAMTTIEISSVLAQMGERASPSIPPHMIAGHALGQLVGTYNAELSGLTSSAAEISYDPSVIERVRRRHNGDGRSALGRAAALALMAAGIVGLALFTWGASTGLVYARARGPRMLRLGKALLVAVFAWPLSFLVWAFARRRRTRPYITHPGA
jgi:hypothetical protein